MTEHTATGKTPLGGGPRNKAYSLFIPHRTAAGVTGQVHRGAPAAAGCDGVAGQQTSIPGDKRCQPVDGSDQRSCDTLAPARLDKRRACDHGDARLTRLLHDARVRVLTRINDGYHFTPCLHPVKRRPIATVISQDQRTLVCAGSQYHRACSNLVQALARTWQSVATCEGMRIIASLPGCQEVVIVIARDRCMSQPRYAWVGPVGPAPTTRTST